jgi:hypothetical protein
MPEELTRALSHEDIEVEEARQKSVRAAKRLVLISIFIVVGVTFLLFTYNEWIHPYPNQYRVVTNGEQYKVEEKNWFFSWHIYKEFDGYYGYRVRHFYSKGDAEEYMEDLKRQEARRMAGKPTLPEDEWKPLK